MTVRLVYVELSSSPLVQLVKMDAGGFILLTQIVIDTRLTTRCALCSIVITLGQAYHEVCDPGSRRDGVQKYVAIEVYG